MAMIAELTTVDEWREAFPVMRELRSHLDEESFLHLLKEMRTESDYRLFALREAGKIVALAGAVVTTNLYNGRHLFIHELVTRAECRSQGYGERLLSFLHRWGREKKCTRAVLSSNLVRRDAHRFYEEKMGYKKVSFVFRRELEGE